MKNLLLLVVYYLFIGPCRWWAKLSLKDLWLAALEGLRFYPCVVPFGWWKKFPFLPLPSMRYITWRLDTAYGQVDHKWDRPSFRKMVGDSMRFLLWRRKNRLARKRR